MGLWEVCIPVEGQNLITNPSIEIGTTGYTAVGGSIARVTAYNRRGIGSLGVTPTSGSTDGVYYTIALSSGITYYFSFDFLSYQNLPYRAYFANTSGSILSSITTWSAVGYSRWMPNRLVVSFTPSSSTNFRLYITKNGGSNTNVFYVDGLQCEEDRQTTYIDGDRPGCLWDGTPHASTSTRDGQSREGGELINLDTFSYSVEAWNGVGAPPVDNVLIRYGLMDGGYYQRTKAASRVLELQGSINVGADKTLNTLHLNRKTFFDALKVDRVDQPQEFWLRYSGTTTPMWIKGVYEGGQEMHYSAKAGFTEKMGVKFLCPDPYFYEDGEQANSLGYTQTVANAAYILQRGTNGNWQALGTGLNGNPLCMAKLSDGGIVVGGSFTTAGGVTVNRFAKWSGSAWSAYGSGFNDAVKAVAISPEGTIYVGGLFTQSGGSTINRVAYWSGSAWLQVGAGFSSGSAVNSMAFSPDGLLYVGSQGDRVYYYSGAAWVQKGSSFNADVAEIAIAPDGTIYAVGEFTTAGSITVNGIARFVSGGTDWEAMGDGFTDAATSPPVSVAIGPDGKVYVGGDFVSSGSVACNKIAVWTGGGWLPLGEGVDGQVGVILVDPDTNVVYLGGSFSTAGGITLPDRFTLWTGSQFLPLEVNLPGTASVTSLLLYRNILTVGYDTTGSATSSVITVNSNSGTKAHPIFTITGPGQIWHIKNFTAKKSIYFTDLILLAGETAILDLTPGNISFISNWRGNLQYSISAGSNLAGFSLLPGANNISLYMSGTDGNTFAYMKWRNTEWMIDGGAV